MNEKPAWKTKYKAQTEWRKRNHYKQFSFQLYDYQIEAIRRTAKEHQLPISKFICNALEAQYEIDLSKPERNASENNLESVCDNMPTNHIVSE